MLFGSKWDAGGISEPKPCGKWDRGKWDIQSKMRIIDIVISLNGFSAQKTICNFLKWFSIYIVEQAITILLQENNALYQLLVKFVPLVPIRKYNNASVNSIKPLYV